MRKQELSIEQWIALCQEGLYNTVKIPLHGVSMQPLVRKDRDLVTVAPMTRSIQKGDVVLFHRADGAWVVHRVLSCEKEKVQTLGDGCLCPDAPIHKNEVYGLIIKVERGSHCFSIDKKFWRQLGIVWMELLPLRRGCAFLYRGLRRFGKRILYGKGK